MTDAAASLPNLDSVTGADIQKVTFASSKAFGHGYEQHGVDSFIDRCAAVVDHLREQLRRQQDEIAGLRERIERDSRSNEVQHAISVLSQAQQTADKTVAQADEYSARVMAEARDLYEDTRRNVATLEQETEDKAKGVYDDALARAATVEREAQDRVAQLTLTAATAQTELDSQTAYLRTLRDATRTQLEVFLEGLLDHVAGEYGRAHPMAAEAANATTPQRVRESNRLISHNGNSAEATAIPQQPDAGQSSDLSSVAGDG
jgi:DivIVA domain-containing protein